MRRSRVVLIAATLLLLAGGCDPTVDRFQENDRYYSIFGYLNASADTQFVRVEPLRDGLLIRAPDTLEGDVTLTNLDTDRTVSLRDSLFRYLDGATAHNFYTTASIEPTTPYRFTVRGPDGAESRVETRVPDTFPPPSVVVSVDEERLPTCTIVGGSSRIAVIEIRGIDRLVAVTARYHMVRPPGVWSFGHLADTVQTATGVIRARVDYGLDYCTIPPDVQGGRVVEKIGVVVAAGSADWPDFVGLDLETETLPTVTSNVEGGVGLLGGVVTDTVVIYPSSEED